MLRFISVFALFLFVACSGDDPKPVAPEAAGKALANVHIPDPNLEKVIRWNLKKPEGPITTQDLASITTLKASNDYHGSRPIYNLSGLEHCTSLDTLYLGRHKIKDITPLGGLTELTFLDLNDNQIEDIKPLAALTRLRWLGLWRNQISDISPLIALKAMRNLSLGENQDHGCKSLSRNVQSSLSEPGRQPAGRCRLESLKAPEEVGVSEPERQRRKQDGAEGTG